jgi:hypothetical protein
MQKRDQDPQDSNADQCDEDDGVLLDSDSDSVASGEKPVGKRQGSALTVILVDEVDLLYEDDAGFWNALGDLSRKSKSPIILTANSLPNGIENCWARTRGSIGYRLLEVLRPELEGCASWLRSVVEREGFDWKLTDVIQQNRALTRIVMACNRDLRRLAHELQLFSHSDAKQLTTSLPLRSHERDDSSDFSSILVNATYKSSFPVPKILSVEPTSVRDQSYSFLTLRGSGFLSLASPEILANAVHDGSDLAHQQGHLVVVRVGGQVCPLARIVNDSTILAVLAPRRPAHFSLNRPQSSSCRILPGRRPWNAELSEVTASSSLPLGLLSTTEGSVSRFPEAALPEGASKKVTRDRMCLLESQISTMSVMTLEEVEDSECEREVEDFQGPVALSSLPSLLPSPLQVSLVDWELVNGVFRSGLCEFMGKDRGIVNSNKSKPLAIGQPAFPEVESAESLAGTAALASDAVWIQNMCCTGAPWLAGACRGFGFDLVAGCCASSNPPSLSFKAKRQRYESEQLERLASGLDPAFVRFS